MAKITFRLSKKSVEQNGVRLHQVLVNVHSGEVNVYGKTDVMAAESYTDAKGNNKTLWKDGYPISATRITGNRPIDKTVRDNLMETKKRLQELEETITDKYTRLLMRNAKPSKKWLQSVINGTEEDAGNKTMTMCDWYFKYIDSPRNGMIRRTKLLHSKIARDIVEFEKERGEPYMLETMTSDDLLDIENWFLSIGLAVNTVATRMKRFRTFYRWANGMNRDYPIEPITHNNPFNAYRVKAERYGTPFYLTIAERNRLEAAELPEPLATQRDIFVFQCLIGCRVSDLWNMTKDSVTYGAVEYIPRKTRDNRPVTVRVPLNERAAAILRKYKDIPGNSLFPFTSQQQYNIDIKEALRLAGIDRIVTVLNPVTREDERHPIWEVASSHMARRTFIGNLYKQVKDPNLVGKLSGHVEGSAAFARYRQIDDEMARELVGMLE